MGGAMPGIGQFSCGFIVADGGRWFMSDAYWCLMMANSLMINDDHWWCFLAARSIFRSNYGTFTRRKHFPPLASALHRLKPGRHWHCLHRNSSRKWPLDPCKLRAALGRGTHGIGQHGQLWTTSLPRYQTNSWLWHPHPHCTACFLKCYTPENARFPVLPHRNAHFRMFPVHFGNPNLPQLATTNL